jgi:hypothetical protein
MCATKASEPLHRRSLGLAASGMVVSNVGTLFLGSLVLWRPRSVRFWSWQNPAAGRARKAKIENHNF